MALTEKQTRWAHRKGEHDWGVIAQEHDGGPNGYVEYHQCQCCGKFRASDEWEKLFGPKEFRNRLNTRIVFMADSDIRLMASDWFKKG